MASKDEGSNAYRVLVGKHERKRPRGIPRHLCEDNIKMNLKEMGYEGVDWTHLAQGREKWTDSFECRSEYSGFLKRWEFVDSLLP